MGTELRTLGSCCPGVVPGRRDSGVRSVHGGAPAGGPAVCGCGLQPALPGSAANTIALCLPGRVPESEDKRALFPVGLEVKVHHRGVWVFPSRTTLPCKFLQPPPLWAAPWPGTVHAPLAGGGALALRQLPGLREPLPGDPALSPAPECPLLQDASEHGRLDGASLC